MSVSRIKRKQTKQRRQEARRGIKAAAGVHAGPRIIAMESEPIEWLEAAADDSGETQLRRFEMVAYTGGVLRVKGWRHGIVANLARCKPRSKSIAIFRDHDGGQIVGHTDIIENDGKQIRLAGVVSGTSGAAQEVVSTADNGFPWRASIGAEVLKESFVKAGAKVQVNGQEFSGPVHVADASLLGESSFVALSADRQSSARIAAELHVGDQDMDFENWLQEKSFSADDLNEDQTKALRATYDAELAAQAGVVGTVLLDASTPGRNEATDSASSAETIDGEILEAQRKTAIAELIVATSRELGTHEETAVRLKEIQAQAIDEGWKVSRLESRLATIKAEYWRSNRPSSGVSMPAAAVDQTQMLTAASMLAAGIREDVITREVGEQSLDAAARQYGSGVGLQELVLIAAAANGYRGRERITVGNWKDIMGWACAAPATIQAGFSTVDLSGILGAVANKAMGAVAAEPQWLAPLICGRASHPNFHSHTIYSMALEGEMQEVGSGGEIKHLSVDEESYTRQVDTKAAMLTISRKDLINDDLGAFTRTAQGMARKAFTSREKVLFTAINATAAGASHFTAARTNYLTGTVFSLAGMGNAIAAFRNMTGPDGDPIMVEPALVMVPSSLEGEARMLLAASSALITTGYSGSAARVRDSNANIYAGRFGGAPLVSPWLEKSTVTGYSATAWYLLAAPGQYPCFEIAYLDGQESPTVEYFGLNASVDVLGVSWRVYWDFGVAMAEWRAGIKSAYA